jgi:hypothetical protein
MMPQHPTEWHQQIDGQLKGSRQSIAKSDQHKAKQKINFSAESFAKFALRIQVRAKRSISINRFFISFTNLLKLKNAAICTLKTQDVNRSACKYTLGQFI